ncbi:MAG: ankyrin repeat domain-containing protein [Candidatus Sericytochromatia bacterium]
MNLAPFLLLLLLQLPPNSEEGPLTPDLRLIQGALGGNAAAIGQALDQGADLEVRHTDRDLTPLMLAIYRDHAAAVDFLLERGANPNARNGRGHTPLMMAAAGGQTALVERLLKAGAELDAEEEIGNTALLWAAYWGHLEVLRLLIEAGASLRIQNDDGNNALLLAAQGGLSQQSRQLVKAAPRVAASGRQLPPVFNDAGETDLIRYLLDKGALVQSRNLQGQTPLMLLAGRGRGGPVKLLLERGAALDTRDQAGRSALDYARAGGHSALVRWLEQAQMRGRIEEIAPLPD